MPFELFYDPSFKRSLKHLGSDQLKIIGCILEALEVYYASGCDLQEARRKAPGFFYKQLRKPYYETGIESQIRVILAKKDSKCIALLAGNHNQIKKFLNNF